MNYSREIKKLIDRIFVSAVVGQALLILLIFFIGLSVYVWNNLRETSSKVELNFREWESRLSEAIYVNSKTGTFPFSELPQVKAFESAMRANGLPVRVQVGECRRGSDDDSLFHLQIGDFELERCVVVSQTQAVAARGVIFGFGLAGFSLLLSFLVWAFWRERFKVKFIDPLILGLEKEAKDAAVGKLASQVAHDIRSPLAALNVLSRDVYELSEEKRVLLQSAIRRIQDIGHNLLPAKKISMLQEASTGGTVEYLPELLCELISEKRLQYSDAKNLKLEFEISAEGFSSFVKIDRSDLLRSISNLLDNAIEAAKNSNPKIQLILTKATEGETRIVILDNGAGIPKEILKKIGEKGASFNKKGGSGLGLAFAKSTVESIGGRLVIDSRLGLGTKVSLFFPEVDPPRWFFNGVDLGDFSRVVVLDDDPSIAELWKTRLKGFDVEVLYFSAPEEVPAELHESEDVYWLVDHEFRNSTQKGATWILEKNLLGKSVLATGAFRDAIVRRVCERFGLRLLAKNLISFVPIDRNIPQENTWAQFLEK